jgi:DNA-binding beta-propeller fold protein YncE
MLNCKVNSTMKSKRLPYVFAALTALTGILAQDVPLKADSITSRVNISTNAALLWGRLSPDSDYLYVSDTYNSTVRKLRTTDFGEVSTITVGTNPWSLDISEQADAILVANRGQSADGSISRIQLSTGTVQITIPLVGQPSDIAINSQGTFAVALISAVSPGSTVTASIIDLSNNSIRTLTVGTGHASKVNFSPDGITAYVTRYDSPSVSKIDVSSGSISTAFTLPTLELGSYPTDLVIDSTHAFVLNGVNTDTKIQKVRLADGIVQSTINVPFGREITATTDGHFLYVADWGAKGRLYKINKPSFVKTSTMSVPHNWDHGILSFDVTDTGTTGYATFNGEVAKLNLDTTASQTVDIQTVSDRLQGAPDFVISAQATSGFTVVFTSLTPTTCSVSGDVVSTLAVGECRISGTQTGGSGWQSATSELSFQVRRQTITLGQLPDVFDSDRNINLVGSSDSGLAIAFESRTPTICSVAGTLLTLEKEGSCTIRASQAGNDRWSAAVSVERTFSIYKDPPSGEPGVSILDGNSYINSKSVELNLVWPRYATSVRVSNDGGFSNAKSSTLSLTPTVKWELDDSIKGIFTKVVYVRFSGPGVDSTKTYSDDIILDTTAPTINSSTAVATTSKIDVKVDATDDITGVEKIEIDNGSKIVSKDYSKSVEVSLSEIGMAVSAASVAKASTQSLQVRVRDGAGNWTKWQGLVLSGKPVLVANQSAGRAMSINTKKAVSGKSIAQFAKLTVPKNSRLSVKVASSSKKICRVVGTSIRGLKAGNCKVTVSAKPKIGKTQSKTVSLKVSK